MKPERKILLVAPENTFGIGFARIPNLGLGYAAAAARAAGFSFDWMDAAERPFTAEQVAHKIRENRYTAIGLNIFTASLGPARRLVSALTDLLPAGALPPVVLGGPHPTFEPADTFRDIPAASYLFTGECEEGFGPLLDLLHTSAVPAPDELAKIPNLAWRAPDGTINVNTRSFVQDLDRIPMLPWDAIRPDGYPLAPNGIFSRQSRIAPMIATRGCPYTCTFCGAPNSMGSKIRTRSPENLIAEIRWLQRDFGIREIHFMDDNFTLDRRFLRNFCEAVLREGLKFDWACPNGVRLDSLTPETLPLMERAGCYSFAVGIESGSQRILDLMEKKLTKETIREKIELVRELTDIRMTGFFVVGVPGETEPEVNETIEFARSLPLHRANFFNYSPFPGSPIYTALKASGKLDGVDLENLYIHRVEFASEELGHEKLKMLQRKAYLRFYLRPRVLWGLAREVKSWSQIATIGRRVGLLMGA